MTNPKQSDRNQPVTAFKIDADSLLVIGAETRAIKPKAFDPKFMIDEKTFKILDKGTAEKKE